MPRLVFAVGAFRDVPSGGGEQYSLVVLFGQCASGHEVPERDGGGAESGVALAPGAWRAFAASARTAASR
ncbi:hypothetical protein GCM10017566_67610 [Amycolatopsis bartoniae]|uniref:Uncharacterized protein n=1 Tax=Amycolatopsis bartoniae TaxID=941986 RepID=A0A8H9J6Z7_9PSEU|nr:hypothetical protein GCM10017566_67610 [Amycolatopsis bartoniae]